MGENSSNNTAQARISSWMLGIRISPPLCPSRVPTSGLAVGFLSLHILFPYPLLPRFLLCTMSGWTWNSKIPGFNYVPMNNYFFSCDEKTKESKFSDKLIIRYMGVLSQAYCKPNQRILSWEKHSWKRRKRKGKRGRRGCKGERRSYKKEDKKKVNK